MEESHPLSVGQILALDETYRQKVKRNNLRQDAQLTVPLMRKSLNKAQVSVCFTPAEFNHCHRTNAVYNWVKVRWQPQKGQSVIWTVLTEWRKGPLQGRRIVRGREEECCAYYADLVAQQTVKRAVTILKNKLGLSRERAYREICAQASGQRVLLSDIATVIVEFNGFESPYPDIFSEVSFDRRPWYKRREEVLTKLFKQ